jgi:hypothetical protein
MSRLIAKYYAYCRHCTFLPDEEQLRRCRVTATRHANCNSREFFDLRFQDYWDNLDQWWIAWYSRPMANLLWSHLICGPQPAAIVVAERAIITSPRTLYRYHANSRHGPWQDLQKMFQQAGVLVLHYQYRPRDCCSRWRSEERASDPRRTRYPIGW